MASGPARRSAVNILAWVFLAASLAPLMTDLGWPPHRMSQAQENTYVLRATVDGKEYTSWGLTYEGPSGHMLRLVETAGVLIAAVLSLLPHDGLRRLGLIALVAWAGLWFGNGLCIAIVAPIHAQDIVQSRYENDSRLSKLRTFLINARSPIQHLAEDFLAAADRYGLDWRLLPCISLIESGAGKQYKRNNIFGWNSGREPFASIRESIDVVASRLANSKLYRNKELDAMLATYNRYPKWAEQMKSLMRRLDPTEPLRARWDARSPVSLSARLQYTGRPAPAQ